MSNVEAVALRAANISILRLLYIYCVTWVSLRFQIDLGRDADDLALHFNPRFHDDTDGSVLVCNSKAAGCWGEEKREIHNPLQRGTDVKVRELD